MSTDEAARKPIHLLSKLTSISTVFAGARVLAIDSSNTPFVSPGFGISVDTAAANRNP